MDTLEETLSGILNDPESMKKVREMAQNLFSGSGESSCESATQGDESTGLSPDLSSLPDMEEMGRIIGIISRLKSGNNDPRAALLLSLKPHLSDRRKDKVDTAVKLLKIIEILPVIKESGLLNL